MARHPTTLKGYVPGLAACTRAVGRTAADFIVIAISDFLLARVVWSSSSLLPDNEEQKRKGS
jgi:hypothetical protein